jgi:hypothetical protein
VDLYRLDVPWDTIDIETDTERVRIGVVAYSKAAIRFDWTGDPTGTLELFSSELPNPSVADDDDWDSMSEDPADPAGSADNSSIVVESLPHRWLMLKYVPDGGTPGSGTLSAHLTLKR